MKTKKNNNAGFVTSIAVVVSLAILVFFGGIYHVLQTSIRENIVIDLRDQSSSVAASGVQQVINIVRANPNLSELEENMKDTDDTLVPVVQLRNGTPDSNGFYDVYHRAYPKNIKDNGTPPRVIGRYFAKVKRINVDDPAWNNATTEIFKDEDGDAIGGDIFHIVVEGRSLNRRDQDQPPCTAHAYVYFTNVGDYFCAVRGHLKVSPGAHLGTGKIYGRSLEFDMTGGANSITMGQAHYDVDFIPLDWPDNPGDARAGAVKIDGPLPPDGTWADKDGNPAYGVRPFALKSPLNFPSINEQIGFYKEVIGGSPEDVTRYRCDFTNSDLYPPSQDLNYGPHVAFEAEFKNKQHAYYCDGDVTIGPAEVRTHGQVIIVAKGQVRLMGSIVINDGEPGQTPHSKSQCPTNCYTSIPDPTPAEPAGIPSRADQLVIYAGGGFLIDKNWCGAAGNHLKLQGVMLIAPDAGLNYDLSGGGCTTYTDYSLDFLGAMYLSDQPFLGGVFAKPAASGPPFGRSYRYLETLATDPPPVRQSFQVLKQFVLRRPAPVGNPISY